MSDNPFSPQPNGDLPQGTPQLPNRPASGSADGAAPRAHETRSSLPPQSPRFGADHGAERTDRTERAERVERSKDAEQSDRRERVERPFRRKDDPKESKKQSRKQPWYIEIPIIIVVGLLLAALFQTFIGRVYVIPSASMEPTLHGCTGCTEDRIFVNKMVYNFGDPHPGDVVVFKGPPSWDEGVESRRSSNGLMRSVQNLGSYVGLVAPDENDLVKRIVATGGQTVECLPGQEGVTVDGKVIDSSYILNPPAYPVGDDKDGSEQCGGKFFGPIVVPKDNVFVMGDNRTNSADSRYHLSDEYQGTIPEDNIIGRVDARIMPLNRIGLIDHPDIQQ